MGVRHQRDQIDGARTEARGHGVRTTVGGVVGEAPSSLGQAEGLYLGGVVRAGVEVVELHTGRLRVDRVQPSLGVGQPGDAVLTGSSGLAQSADLREHRLDGFAAGDRLEDPVLFTSAVVFLATVDDRQHGAGEADQRLVAPDRIHCRWAVEGETEQAGRSTAGTDPDPHESPLGTRDEVLDVGRRLGAQSVQIGDDEHRVPCESSGGPRKVAGTAP